MRAMRLMRRGAVLLAVSTPPAAADEPAAAGLPTSIWDGVYTEAQARRGELIYPSICGRCHGRKLDGAPDDPDFLPAPPIAGPKFLRQWNGASLAALFEYTQTAMPSMNPGSLSDREFADVVAYTLEVTGAPPGPAELVPDAGAMAGIAIEPEP
jgi:mono/diheme cytochrome c family protein